VPRRSKMPFWGFGDIGSAPGAVAVDLSPSDLTSLVSSAPASTPAMSAQQVAYWNSYPGQVRNAAGTLDSTFSSPLGLTVPELQLAVSQGWLSPTLATGQGWLTAAQVAAAQSPAAVSTGAALNANYQNVPPYLANFNAAVSVAPTQPGSSSVPVAQPLTQTSVPDWESVLQSLVTSAAPAVASVVSTKIQAKTKNVPAASPATAKSSLSLPILLIGGGAVLLTVVMLLRRN